MELITLPDEATWESLIHRPQIDHNLIRDTVTGILEDIKKRGDIAIVHFNRLFGGAGDGNFIVSQSEIEQAVSRVDDRLKAAIRIAIQNIELFHRSQKRQVKRIETTHGVTCWRKQVAINRVGLYIPGGTAPLFSTLLMLAIPAKIAGCKKIVVCSPPQKNGLLDPAILYSAWSLGLKNIFKIGGAQAICAMSRGTASIPIVDKIFGPGNQYVTAAKQLVQLEGTAIDLPAGPSEVLIIADGKANAAFIAADLIAQAEHGPDSQVILATDDKLLIKKVTAETRKQLRDLPRAAIAERSMQNSKLILFKNLKQALAFSNLYAPEHLIIMVSNPRAVAAKIENAGSVFIGPYSPEAAGDYASGTNHTLPTAGYARSYSGISLDSFYKTITFQEISEEGIRLLGPAVSTMAEAEQLSGHARSVRIRIDSIKKTGF
jgi:histidinol dehydrogenase